MLRQIELSDRLGLRWRHAGATSSPEEFVRRIWSGVLCQHIVVRKADNYALGVAVCSGADFAHGFAHLGFARFDPERPSLEFMEGAAIFIDYLFSVWPFRKLYLEVPEYNLDQVGSGLRRLFREEGRFADHFVVGQTLWDQHIFAIERDDWSQIFQGIRPYIFKQPSDEGG